MLAASLALLGCASASQPRTATPDEERRLYPQLHPELHPESQVPGFVTVSRVEPGAGCAFLGVVTASEGSDADPYAGLREHAQGLGGNYLVPEGSRPSGLGWGYSIRYEARGRAYRCVAGARAAVPVPAYAGSVCEPACSPGFTCLRGTCVSACNPPCSSDAQCGPDRLCHPIR